MGNARLKVDFDEQVWKRNVETAPRTGGSETFPSTRIGLFPMLEQFPVIRRVPNTFRPQIARTLLLRVAANDSAIGLSSNDLPATPRPCCSVYYTASYANRRQAPSPEISRIPLVDVFLRRSFLSPRLVVSRFAAKSRRGQRRFIKCAC